MEKLEFQEGNGNRIEFEEYNDGGVRASIESRRFILSVALNGEESVELARWLYEAATGRPLLETIFVLDHVKEPPFISDNPTKPNPEARPSRGA